MEGKHGHSSSGGFHGYEQQLRRVQGENDYLRERIKSCERGLVSLWQVSERVRREKRERERERRERERREEREKREREREERERESVCVCASHLRE